MGVREEIIPFMDRPRCPRELCERTGRNRKGVETALQRMVRDRLARCVTPDRRQPRFYVLTALGEMFRQELTPPGVQAPHPSHPPQLGPDELQLYAWVQSGVYRRVCLRHMGLPMRARELRKKVITEHERIGMNHVQAVLREFEARGIAARREGRWSPTPLGERLRNADLAGLPERPRVGSSPWVRAGSWVWLVA